MRVIYDELVGLIYMILHGSKMGVSVFDRVMTQADVETEGFCEVLDIERGSRKEDALAQAQARVAKRKAQAKKRAA